MKILIVTPIFPPEIGGPATYVKEFAIRATGLGHSVTVISLTDTELEKIGGIQIVQVKRTRSRLLLLYRYYSLLLKILSNATSCDVIYAQNPSAVGLPAIIIGKLLRKPVVVKYVGDTAWEKASREGKTKKLLEDFLKEPDANKNIMRIERFVFKRAKRIITPSNYLANILTRYYNVPPEKIAVIGNAVETEQVSGKRARENLIITVARLVPWKGVQDIIDVMPEISEKTGAKLWVVGDGPYRKALEKRAKEIKADVIFFGVLPHKDTLEKMAAARVFVLNSLYEGLPHVLLEAMAVGTPIVATDICGNSEVIKDGKTGLLVPPRDKAKLKEAILTMLADKKRADAFAIEGMMSVKSYNWDALIERTLEALSFARN